MLHKQLKICFFVGYLGLLLNLGPSLHHAPIFGLHGHSHSAESPGHTCHSSCCGHAHTHTLPQQESDENSVASTSDHHDCSFCKFFDQLHVIVECVQTLEASDFAEMREAIKPVDAFTVCFVPQARGPPVLA